MDRKGKVLHSETRRGSKLRCDEIRPTGKAFDDILAGDHGVAQYGISEMTKKTEEQHFELCMRRWMVQA